MWYGHDELSLDKEKSKQSMVYYASPVGLKYGYYSSLNKTARDQFLKDVNNV